MTVCELVAALGKLDPDVSVEAWTVYDDGDDDVNVVGVELASIRAETDYDVAVIRVSPRY